jgi:transcriptional regulator with XRE-family HTH domain
VYNITINDIQGGETLKDIIKKLRKKRGLTQKQLAEKLGVQQTTISMWETGANRPNVDMLKPLAKILKCKVEDLFK